MTDRSHLVQQVLDAAAGADGPTAAEHARAWEGLSSRIAAGDPGPALDAQPGVAGSTAAIKIIVVAVVVSAAVVAAALATRGDPPSPMTARLAEAEISPVAAVASQPLVEPNAEAPSVEGAAAARRPGKRRPTKRDGAEGHDLAAEVNLMKGARQALRAGQHRKALALLGQHKRRFPRGRLARERELTKVTVLCGLGRTKEATATARGLLARSKGQLLRTRLAQTCVGELE